MRGPAPPASAVRLRTAAVVVTLAALASGVAWNAGRLGTVVHASAAITRPSQEDQEQQGRDRWQRVPELLAAVGASSGAHVADVGSGDGFLTVRLARAVGPTGRVYAVDINAEALQRLRRRIDAEGLENVEVIEGAADDPRLPAGALDGVVIVNAYHEMAEHEAMLRRLHTALKPAGRLVLAEPISEGSRGLSRDEQVQKHDLEAHYVEAELRAAGFHVAALTDPFATTPDGREDYWLIVARRQLPSGQ